MKTKNFWDGIRALSFLIISALTVTGIAFPSSGHPRHQSQDTQGYSQASFQSLNVVRAQNTPATQRTLLPFRGSSTRLSAQQQAQIAAALAMNPNAVRIVCTGFRNSGQSSSLNVRSRVRATNACNYAKSLRQDLVVSVRSKLGSSPSQILRVQIAIFTSLPAVAVPSQSAPVVSIPETSSTAVSYSPELESGSIPSIEGSARPESSLSLNPGTWKNATVLLTPITWRLCKQTSQPIRIDSIEPNFTSTDCSFSGLGSNYAIPSKLQLLGSGMKVARVTYLLSSKLNTSSQIRFVTLEKALIDAEHYPISNLSSPIIQGEARPLSTLTLNKGSWLNGAPANSIAYWYLCDRTDIPLRIVDGSSLVTPTGCDYLESADMPLTIYAENDIRLQGKKSVRALFLVSGPQGSNQFKTVTLETPLVLPQKRFSVSISNLSRSLTMPGSEQVLLDYTIVNNSGVPLKEKTLSIFDAAGNEYRPLSFASYESQTIPVGVTITRSLVWQLRTTVGQQLRVGLYQDDLIQVPNLKNLQISRITSVSASTNQNGITKIEWNPVSTYVDGSPLQDEGRIIYYTETTVPGTQTQRVYYESPYFFATNTANGLQVKIWVLGRQSVSLVTEFSVFGDQVFLSQ